MPRITKPIDGSRSPSHALGAAVRDLRYRRVISQEDLGFRTGLHRNYIGALERGEINPTFRTLLRVVHGLDVPLSEVIDRYEAHAAHRPERIAS
jgi:transcriptional regulator with XRE-family HTH domain